MCTHCNISHLYYCLKTLQTPKIEFSRNTQMFVGKIMQFKKDGSIANFMNYGKSRMSAHSINHDWEPEVSAGHISSEESTFWFVWRCKSVQRLPGRRVLIQGHSLQKLKPKSFHQSEFILDQVLFIIFFEEIFILSKLKESLSNSRSLNNASELLRTFHCQRPVGKFLTLFKLAIFFNIYCSENLENS